MFPKSIFQAIQKYRAQTLLLYLLCGLSALLSLFSTWSQAAPHSSFALSRAWESNGGQIWAELVSTDPQDQRLDSEKTLFWGNSRELRQLELGLRIAAPGIESVNFVQPGFVRSPSVEMTSVGASLICARSDSAQDLHPLSARKLHALEARIHGGNTRIRLLPHTYKSRWLFENSATGEWIWVREPHFGHGQFDVQIGRPGRWRKLAQSRSKLESGIIRFAGGDGLYVPTLGSVLINVPTKQEMPLWVSHDGSLQELQIPRLKRALLAHMGFGIAPSAASVGPCEPPTSRYTSGS